MKRTLVLALLAFVAVAQMNAQTANKNPKQALKEHNAAVKAVDKEKAAKAAQKEEKKKRKEGWSTMTSDKPMGIQITEEYVQASEVITDVDGNTRDRWIKHTAMATQGTYNAAVAQARLACQAEIATQLKSFIAGIGEGDMTAAQESADKAVGAEKFEQHFKTLVDACLKNMKRGLCIYRRTPNGNFEVEVTYAIDMKETVSRMARQAQQDLEDEDDPETKKRLGKFIEQWK